MKQAVLLTDARSPEAGATGEYLRSRGYNVYENDPDTQVSLYDEAALARLALELPPLKGVIHPAPPRLYAACETATDDMWARARDEGVMAAWAVTKVMAEKLIKDGGGSIIYLGSIHAEKPLGEGFLYSMGCAAAQMLCREASQIYAERGVSCFYVQRGPLAHEEAGRKDKSSVYFGTDMRYPKRQIPENDYLGGLIAFLLSDASWPLNGSDLKADGGMTMYYGHRSRVEGVKYYEWPGK